MYIGSFPKWGGHHFCLSQRKGSYKNASKRTKGCKRTKQQYRDMNLKRWANKTPKEEICNKKVFSTLFGLYNPIF